MCSRPSSESHESDNSSFNNVLSILNTYSSRTSLHWSVVALTLSIKWNDKNSDEKDFLFKLLLQIKREFGADVSNKMVESTKKTLKIWLKNVWTVNS